MMVFRTWLTPYPVALTREMHITKEARDRYAFDDSLFSFHGDAIVANLGQAQRVSQRINEERNARQYPESAVRASELYAAGLIEELLHLLIAEVKASNAHFFMRAYRAIETEIGSDALIGVLRSFSERYPATPVYKGTITAEQYLFAKSDGVSHRLVVLEELLLLKLNNENPAMEGLRELFDDRPLQERTAYRRVLEGFEKFTKGEPPLQGFGSLSLFDVLRGPMNASPTSLEGQLRFLRDNYGKILGNAFRVLTRKVLLVLDVLREDTAMRGGFGGGPPPAVVTTAEMLRGGALLEGLSAVDEVENFSADSDWMPNLVLIAKNTHVWLDQLSQQYEHSITTLADIPDEALKELVDRGFSGLWLIGIWERSSASQEIKRRMGNRDALASAYSLYDYTIAQDLGGEAAYEVLRDRAWAYGLRLGSDMVPNHMGVDSRWVVEHPDWFLQLGHTPYPSYSFESENLSQDSRVTVQLEDHYYDKTDAAVVFKRTDSETGDVAYIYHGNDGTSMPWNDTAQLNYLKRDVREAVIQTVVEVARRFPIIRFDAAMTLAKRHIQRLWFPEPGQGGAIPSRSQYGGMSTVEFNRHVPHEFWRELVDRIEQEAPDTLLLAEAFWLMEGYFVRTLGMHRVYNSAFMHMLRDEENAKYRASIKNVLAFEPEILNRYVNFMSNPDEESAMRQFGDGDKYFGICMMMATLPGLPMFGHGQLEGFSEKYGMEFKRALKQEQPIAWFLERHKREITPILKRRKLFAGVKNFRFYDAFTAEGVNENIFAYSNQDEQEPPVLFVFNNAFESTQGTLKQSVPHKEGEAETLASIIGMSPAAGAYVTFKDHVSGLEFLRSTTDVISGGLTLSLTGYQYQLLGDFKQLADSDGNLERLHARLAERGVLSLSDEIKLMELEPLHSSYRQLISADLLAKVAAGHALNVEAITQNYRAFLTMAVDFEAQLDIDASTQQFSESLHQLQLILDQAKSASLRSEKRRVARHGFPAPLILIWLTLRDVRDCLEGKRVPVQKVWRLPQVVFENLQQAMDDVKESEIHEYTQLLNLLIKNQDVVAFTPDNLPQARELITSWMQDAQTRNYLRTNTHEGTEYYHKESYERFIAGLATIWSFVALTDAEMDDMSELVGHLMLSHLHSHNTTRGIQTAVKNLEQLSLEEVSDEAEDASDDDASDDDASDDDDLTDDLDSNVEATAETPEASEEAESTEASADENALEVASTEGDAGTSPEAVEEMATEVDVDEGSSEGAAETILEVHTDTSAPDTAPDDAGEQTEAPVSENASDQTEKEVETPPSIAT